MTKAQFLEICSQRWEDIENLSNLKSFYEIEKTLDEAVSYTHLTAADERSSVDLGGRRIIKKKKHTSPS